MLSAFWFFSGPEEGEARPEDNTGNCHFPAGRWVLSGTLSGLIGRMHESGGAHESVMDKGEDKAGEEDAEKTRPPNFPENPSSLDQAVPAETARIRRAAMPTLMLRARRAASLSEK